jgi:hypothetical protein
LSAYFSRINQHEIPRKQVSDSRVVSRWQANRQRHIGKPTGALLLLLNAHALKTFTRIWAP